MAIQLDSANDTYHIDTKEIVSAQKITALKSENKSLKKENAELKKKLNHYETINEMTREF